MEKSRKMIAISLYFWTDGLPAEIDGNKTCWEGGQAWLKANTKKNIRSLSEPFNNLEDLGFVIREMFRKSGIVTVNSCRRPRAIQKMNRQISKKVAK